jgi:hypothetical protein
MSRNPDVSFTVTGSGKIELMAESAENLWIVQITKDGNIHFLRNMKSVEAFPSTPLTKKLIEATAAIHREAVEYLIKSWEQGKPWDDQEGRQAWWRMKERVESF